MDLAALLQGFKRATGARWCRFLISVTLVGGLGVKLHVAKRLSMASFEVNWAIAALAITVTVVLVSTRAWRWNVILGDLGRRLLASDLLRIYGATFFLGLVSPAKVGEASRIWLVREQAGGLPAAAFSVALDRIFDLLPTLLITAVFGALVGAGDKGLLVDSIRGVFAVLALVVVALLMRPVLFQAGVQRLASRLLTRFAHEDEVESDAGVKVPIRRDTVLKAFAFSIISQALLLLQTYLFARAVSADINPLVGYAVVIMASVVASLPLSIGGVGTREAAMVWALTSLGLSTGQAIAFSVVALVNFLTIFGLSMIVFINQPLQITERLAGHRRNQALDEAKAHAVIEEEG